MSWGHLRGAGNMFLEPRQKRDEVGAHYISNCTLPSCSRPLVQTASKLKRPCPARRRSNAGLTLCHCRRRWPNVKPALAQSWLVRWVGRSWIGRVNKAGCFVWPDCRPRLWPNVGLMLAQRLRRWVNINPTLDHRPLFAGLTRGQGVSLVTNTSQMGSLWLLSNREVYWN